MAHFKKLSFYSGVKFYFEGNSVAQPQELLETKKLIKGEKTPV